MPLLLEVEFARTVPIPAQLAMELEPAHPALVDSTSSKDNVKLPALLVPVQSTESAHATQELSPTAPALQPAHQDLLQFLDHASHATLTALNAQETPTDAPNASLDSKLIPANDVFLPLNAHTAKNSRMENARTSATVDSCSTKAFAFSEDASLDMLTMGSEDALEVHQPPGHQANQLPALLANSS